MANIENGSIQAEESLEAYMLRLFPDVPEHPEQQDATKSLEALETASKNATVHDVLRRIMDPFHKAFRKAFFERYGTMPVMLSSGQRTEIREIITGTRLFIISIPATETVDDTVLRLLNRVKSLEGMPKLEREANASLGRFGLRVEGTKLIRLRSGSASPGQSANWKHLTEEFRASVMQVGFLKKREAKAKAKSSESERLKSLVVRAVKIGKDIDSIGTANAVLSQLLSESPFIRDVLDSIVQKRVSMQVEVERLASIERGLKPG
jgi:hypothetical protein